MWSLEAVTGCSWMAALTGLPFVEQNLSLTQSLPTLVRQAVLELPSAGITGGHLDRPAFTRDLGVWTLVLTLV